MQFESVCYVNATSEKYHSKGVMSLLRVSDTIYIMEFKDSRRSICVDLDLVLFEGSNSVLFKDQQGTDEILKFNVQDTFEMNLLIAAKLECDTLCDLKLRLNSLLRDVYFSGFYNNISTECKYNVSEEVEKLKIENPNLFFNALVDQAESVGSSTKPYMSTTNIQSDVDTTNVKCIFCDVSRLIDKDRDFVVHPYVPKNFQSCTVYMCSICIENWKEYREAAEHEEQLVLEDEVNEEICAICSDTPETLVLCSGCPRSFCDNCLGKILSKQELQELTVIDADWICMCCLTGVSASPLLSRDCWKRMAAAKPQSGGDSATKLREKEKLNMSKLSGTTLFSDRPPIPPVSAAEAQRRLQRQLQEKEEEEEDREFVTSDVEDDPSDEQPTGNKVGGSASDKPEKIPHKSVSRTVTQSKATVETVAPLSASGRAARNKRKSSSNEADESMPTIPAARSGRSAAAAESVSSEVLPPVNTELDEVYYFSQYVHYYDNFVTSASSSSKKRASVALSTTDDVCFLCKDGGELIECDWTHPSDKKVRCLKVYHEYCLDYEVKEGIKWCCPRHFCDMCGSQQLKCICKYCPVAVCAACPSEMVKKYGHVNYSALDDPHTGEFGGGAEPIACHSCIDMLQRSMARPGLLDNLDHEVVLDVKQFPGVPGRDAKRSVFKKSRTSSTNLSTIVPTAAAAVVSEEHVHETVNSKVSRPRRSSGRQSLQAVDVPSTSVSHSVAEEDQGAGVVEWQDGETEDEMILTSGPAKRRRSSSEDACETFN